MKMRMGVVSHVVAIMMSMTMMWLSLSTKTSMAQDEPAAAPIPPSVAELGKCWVRLDQCIHRNYDNRGSDPRFDESNPAFDKDAFYCCALMQDSFDADIDCYCSIDDLLHEDPNKYYITEAAVFCSSTITHFDELCAGHLTPPATG